MAMPLRLRPSGLSRNLFNVPKQITPPARCRVSPSRSYGTSDRLPKIADASVWTAMIPRFIRNRKPRQKSESKEWNPATFYIIMFTLIGSQAIRMLTLKNDYAGYRRTTDAKIELLKEVIERVKSGEKVDVEKLLGTGDEAKEKEWEEVLREIEQEDTLWSQRSKKETIPEPPKERTEPTQMSQGKDSAVPSTASADDETMRKTQSTRKMNFF
ncbi:hypothetical protein N7532_006302 [Penicillium argentinense]|uniref:Uncharacterized protein n=1 Tax=Penicillium argentinense TaxID=1131581 RepID=A0A9W9KB73_9EURO|nr:uncharacterized protein N7532_006302 [Penicillium argentinense]KAJ5099301.1 hypothetical protein N7532_006302 [Penicillium argentinense]